MKLNKFAIGCVGLAGLMGLATWGWLPDQVPSHWNIRGEVDGYFSRTMTVLALPLLLLGIAALFALLPPPRTRATWSDGMRQTYARFGNYVLLFMLFVHAIILANGVGWVFEFVRVMMLGMGLLFAALGNEMGRLQPNPYAGIRLPWTLNNADVWRRTHRVAGRWMVFGALVGWVLALVLPLDWFWLTLAPIMLPIFAAIVYSYAISRGAQNVNQM